MTLSTPPCVPSPRSWRLWGPGSLHPGRDESPGTLCHPWACIQNLPQPQPAATPSSSHGHRRSFWRVTASAQGADWLLRSQASPTLVGDTRGPSLTAQPWSRGQRTARHSPYHLLIPVPRQKGQCSVPCFPPMSGRGFPERRLVGQAAAGASPSRDGQGGLNSRKGRARPFPRMREEEWGRHSPAPALGSGLSPDGGDPTPGHLRLPCWSQGCEVCKAPPPGGGFSGCPHPGSRRRLPGRG